jgi:hypothetical protein
MFSFGYYELLFIAFDLIIISADFRPKSHPHQDIFLSYLIWRKRILGVIIVMLIVIIELFHKIKSVMILKKLYCSIKLFGWLNKWPHIILFVISLSMVSEIPLWNDFSS